MTQLKNNRVSEEVQFWQGIIR